MNKYIISAGIATLAISSVSALESGAARENIRPVMMNMKASSTLARPAIAATALMQAMPLIPVTGDAATDATIKALQTEMEAKIKVIRDDYQAKIKAVIGDKKILNRPPMATSSQREMMRKEGEGERPMMGGATGTRAMEVRKEMMQNGSTSAPRPVGRMMGGQVKGAETSEAQTGGLGIFGFFGKMFSR